MIGAATSESQVMAAHSAPAARLIELDALRGIAVLLVIAFHYTARFPILFSEHAPMPWTLGWGDDGVQLFFAISGFVILMTLDRVTRARDFVRARFSRLFPTYWTAMLITALVVLAAGVTRLQVSPLAFAANATMLHSWLSIPSVDGAYWSLAVELQFYAMMLLLWWCRALPRLHWLLAAWLLLHLVWGLNPALPSRVGEVLILPHIPYFALGMVVYLYRTARISGIVAGALTLLAVIVAGLVIPRAWLVCGVIALLFWAVQFGWMRWLAVRPLLWVGALSYPLYLLHQNIGYVIIDGVAHAGLPLWAGQSAALFVALLLANFLHHLVEQPAAAWLRR